MDTQSPTLTRIASGLAASPRKELSWLVMILVAGLLPRLVFAHGFPSLPISDFRSLLNFAIAFQADWLARSAEQWRLLSPGLPFLLSLLLRVIPRSPESVGRLSTVILTGLVPVLPYAIWNGAFRLRTRVIAAFLLALWPGQVLFSTVIAQDNWVIPPTVALVALAVRLIVLRGGGKPVAAALLYVVAAAVREEMLLILLPVALFVAAGAAASKRLRGILVGGSLAALILGALVVQRGVATGRYTLFTQHLGASVLGAYVPGAGLVWVSPVPFVEASMPALLQSHVSDRELNRAEVSLAWHELLRRPQYHASRVLATTLLSFLEMDSAVTSWSLVQPGVMPPELRKAALALRISLRPLLLAFPLLLQACFAASVYFASARRSLWRPLCPALVPIVLKVGLHVLVVSQARYFLVVAALEMLVIAVVTEVCFEPAARRLLVRSVLLGAATAALLLALAVSARGYVLQNIEPLGAGAVRSGQLFSSLHVHEPVACLVALHA